MSSFFSLEDYVPPEWSHLPQHKYYFEVLKDGCVMGKLEIRHKAFNLVGRLEDISDISIDNQTVSRKHAILQGKKDDHYIYLYDLGSTHGTFVNKEKLPARTYKKLNPFDSVKFGVSSRIYILRSPELEDQLQNEQIEKDSKFIEMIEKQNRQLSKEEIKARYLDFLENDPNFAANQAPRKLVGREEEEEDEYEGIDWGISDEREVYGYKNQNDMPIQPDLLRRLPLESSQLNKVGEYEENLRRYQDVEAQLNEITSKEKREFGLEEKLQDKKDKLEKRFVEALQALERVEDWLRSNIFGEAVERNIKNIAKIKEKENDTFGDDEFLDRTLENKDKKVAQTVVSTSITTQDYWKLQKQLEDCIKNLAEVRQKKAIIQQAPQQSDENKIQQQDQFQQFMKNNNANLENENMSIMKRQQQLLNARISQIQSKLKSILGDNFKITMKKPNMADQKRSIKDDYKQKSIQQNLMQAKRKMQINHSIQTILNRLQSQSRQDEDVNQLDPSIFNYYKGKQDEEDDLIDLDDEHQRKRLGYNPQKFQKPIKKHLRMEDLQEREEEEEEEGDGELVVDLTKTFN